MNIFLFFMQSLLKHNINLYSKMSTMMNEEKLALNDIYFVI